MLIIEVLGYIKVNEISDTSIEIQKTVDDLIIALRKKNMTSVGLADIAGELQKSMGHEIYVDINDPEFINTLTSALYLNDWVEDVSGGTVTLKQNKSDLSGEHGEASAEDAEHRREKTQALASKNIKDRRENNGELSR